MRSCSVPSQRRANPTAPSLAPVGNYLDLESSLAKETVNKEWTIQVPTMCLRQRLVTVGIITTQTGQLLVPWGLRDAV